jgi:transcriptional regulator with XRE-family HTH domain
MLRQEKRYNASNMTDNKSIYSEADLLGLVGRHARQRRLDLGLRQKDLARSAGVPIATLQRFEHGHSVGFGSVILVALALGAEEEFTTLFPVPERRSLDDILRAQKRTQRARARRRS